MITLVRLKSVGSKFMSESKRINKYISETGYCSRRAADDLVTKGQVSINGTLATTGMRVVDGDVVKVKGKTLRPKPKTVYLAFNKPIGITTTTDLRDKDNIIDFIGYKERIFPIGRLDKASNGLIFLTNDGDIVNKILRAGNNHEKEYVVTVDHKITDQFIEKMGKGVKILGTYTKPCKVRKVNQKTFNIILTQGLNRQIRRMCGVLGYDVTSLKRVRIMNVALGNLKDGHYRKLTQDEMAEILKAVSDSSKTEEASNAKKPKKKAAYKPTKEPGKNKKTSFKRSDHHKGSNMKKKRGKRSK